MRKRFFLFVILAAMMFWVYGLLYFFDNPANHGYKSRNWRVVPRTP